MKFNKVFSILSLVMLVGITGSSFSMESEKLNSSERFHKIDELELHYRGCKAISPCGNYVASGSGGSGQGEIKVWDIRTNGEVCSYSQSIWNWVNGVECVCFSPCGNYVASGSGKSGQGEVKVWDIRTNGEVCSYNHNDRVMCVCFSPCGNYVASWSYGGEMKIWGISKNREVCTYNHSGRGLCVCFSPCGNYVASGSVDDKKVIVWDIGRGREVCLYNQSSWHWNSNRVNCVCFSPCGNYVASGSGNYGQPGEVKVWDIRTKRELCSYNHNDCVECVHFSPCGNYVVSGSSFNGEVKVWNIRTDRAVCSYNHNAAVWCVCFSPCGNYVASGSGSRSRLGEVKVWDIRQNREVCSYNHNGWVLRVCFSNDHTKLISVDLGGQVIIHETSQEYQEAQRQYEKEDEEIIKKDNLNEKKQEDRSFFTKTIHWAKDTFTALKDKVKPHITPNKIILSGCLIYCLYSTARCSIRWKKTAKNLQNAPYPVRQYIINVAKKLHIKNPEEIKVKMMYSRNQYNGFSDIFGNIILSRKACQNLHSKETKFIIGHELSHHKHKDAIKRVFSEIALKLACFYLYAKYNPLNSLNKSDKTNKRFKTKEKIILTSALAAIHFIAFNKIISSLCNVTISQSLRKFFEIRADLESASLGRKFAIGGIKLFKNIRKRIRPILARISWKRRLQLGLSDPHPSLSKRIRYLRWFKRRFYPSNWKIKLLKFLNLY